MGYKIFTRTWWRHNPSWPNGKEPHVGRKTTIRTVKTEADARMVCRNYNNTHEPGAFSRKAEYMEI